MIVSFTVGLNFDGFQIIYRLFSFGEEEGKSADEMKPSGNHFKAS